MRFSDKLMAKAEKHYNITRTLFMHYEIDRELNIPIVEYSRYVLTKGTEVEMTLFATGLETRLILFDGLLGFDA